MESTRISRCRVCNKKDLITIGSLGDIAISDFVEEPTTAITAYPLELVWCSKCTLLQLAHNTPRDLLYKNYWYKSALNQTIVQDLQEIVHDVMEMVDYTEEDIFLDIGANDGTLLSFVKGMRRVAIEPANNFLTDLKQVAEETYVGYFEDTELEERPKIITAIAMLYDLPNPNLFVQKIKKILHPNGVFVAQLMTLVPMIENTDVGNICHEHLEYYSYKSLVRLFEQNGLEIFRVEENDMNGGSYRLYIQHFQEESQPSREKVYTLEDLKNFFERIEENKSKMQEFISRHQTEVYGYGASTKANTILQYYNVMPVAIVDINPLKKGKYTINTNIPIRDTIPSNDICKYLWIFPYGFLDYFKKKEKNYKGKWVTTIPQFEISP